MFVICWTAAVMLVGTPRTRHAIACAPAGREPSARRVAARSSAIARALAMEPSVLIMEEVTSARDADVQALILNLLRDLQRELGMSYLLISHDLSVISILSDYIVIMYAG